MSRGQCKPGAGTHLKRTPEARAEAGERLFVIIGNDFRCRAFLRCVGLSGLIRYHDVAGNTLSTAVPAATSRRAPEGPKKVVPREMPLVLLGRGGFFLGRIALRRFY
ncbi:MAG TPA: hypothetical protein DCD97_00525 [Firmicutes bacterium]|nr:hypothetical protein [Bacillota bacterium]